MIRSQRLIPFILIGCACASSAALAADAPKRPWTDSADFGLALTSGNTENFNLALGNKFKYTWSGAELTFDAVAIRNESTTTTYDNQNGVVTKTSDKAVTGESYFLALKYRRDITARFYWLVGASWYQNFFSGVDDRYLAGGGVGYAFVKQPKHVLKGEAGLDVTREDPLGDPPPKELETTDYASLHLYLGYEYTISETAKLTEDLNVLENLDTTSDWRANSVTAVTASLTSKLAIKVSFTALYDNEPAVRSVPDSATPANPPVAVPFEKTDTILSAALVVNF